MNHPRTSQDKLFPIAIICLIAGIIFIRYYGLSSAAYQDLYQHILNPDLYRFDIYLQNTFYIDSSLVYQFVKATRFSPDNDYIGFAYHVFFSVIGIFYLYKIIKEHGMVYSPTSQFVIIVSFLTLDHGLLQEIKSSVIFLNQGFSTAYGQGLLFPLIYYTLNRQVLILALINSVLFSISIKTGLFAAFLSWSYLFFYLPKHEKRKLLLVLLPIITAYFMSRGAPIEGTYEDRILMVKNAIDRTRDEDVLHLQPKRNLLVLFFSFFSCVYLLKLSEKANTQTLHHYFKIVFIFSLILAIGGGLYGLGLYKIYPDPRLIMLSTVRSLAIYQLCYFLLISVLLHRSNHPVLIKLLFSAGLFYWDLKFNYTFKPVWNAVLLWGVVVIYFLIKLTEKSGFINITEFIPRAFRISISWSSLSKWIFILICIPNLVAGYFNYAGSSYSANQHRLINKWYSSLSDYPELEKTAISLRQCEDFLMLAVLKRQEDDSIIYDLYANYLSTKSKYLGDLYPLALNPAVHRIATERQQAANNALLTLSTSSSVGETEIQKFSDSGLVLLTNLNPENYQFGADQYSLLGNAIWLVSYGPKINTGSCRTF